MNSARVFGPGSVSPSAALQYPPSGCPPERLRRGLSDPGGGKSQQQTRAGKLRIFCWQLQLQPPPQSLSLLQMYPLQVSVAPPFTGPLGPWFTGPLGPWFTGPLGPWSTGPSCWARATPGTNTANAAPAKAAPAIRSACPRERPSPANPLAKTSTACSGPGSRPGRVPCGALWWSSCGVIWGSSWLTLDRGYVRHKSQGALPQGAL